MATEHIVVTDRQHGCVDSWAGCNTSGLILPRLTLALLTHFAAAVFPLPVVSRAFVVALRTSSPSSKTVKATPTCTTGGTSPSQPPVRAARVRRLEKLVLEPGDPLLP